MPATAYPAIQEVHRNGRVSRAKIRKAVEKVAELRETDPAAYRKKIQAGSTREIRLVLKHAQP